MLQCPWPNGFAADSRRSIPIPAAVARQMIKAVFFDFYNTLARFWPPLDQIQQAACRELGLHVDAAAIDYGYSVADLYFNRENEIRPLAQRSDAERLAFFARYEQLLLEKAGLPVSLDLARQVWQIAISVPKDFIPFADTRPALARLRAQGYRLGVITNLRRDLDQLCDNLGLTPYLDFILTAAEVGAEKPAPEMFAAALQRAAARPGEAVHVGDQPRSDVLGARAAGIYPVLLDRGGWQTGVTDCVRISALAELEPLLAAAPTSLQPPADAAPWAEQAAE